MVRFFPSLSLILNVSATNKTKAIKLYLYIALNLDYLIIVYYYFKAMSQAKH